MTYNDVPMEEAREEEDMWDEEEAEWHRLEQNRRTCIMRRTCAIAVLVVYVFLIVNWRMSQIQVN